MKRQVFLFIGGILLLIPSLTHGSNPQAVYGIHLAWKAAFEKTDMDAIDEIWSHENDTMLITLRGEMKNGWKEIQAELLFGFQITGETQIDESDLLITIAENTASATSDYRWSPAPDVPFRATELYRKENGTWKMIAQDGAGGLEPLRVDDGTRIQAQVQQSHSAIDGADLDKLLPLIADENFTYVAFNGTVHQGFDAAVILDDLEKIQKVRLDVVFLTGDRATAHFTLIQDEEREIQLTYENFQLTAIDFGPKPLAVEAGGKLSGATPRVPALTMMWGQIKAGALH